MTMNGGITDAAIERLIASLPYHSPSRGFNGRVLAALAPARAPGFWTEKAGKALAVIVLSWTALAAALGATFLVFRAGEILAFLAEPGKLLASAGLFAANAWAVFTKIAIFCGPALRALPSLTGGASILPDLAAASVTAALAIIAVSRPAQHPAGRGRL